MIDIYMIYANLWTAHNLAVSPREVPQVGNFQKPEFVFDVLLASSFAGRMAV